MSREIDQSRPLSAEDRQYLLERGHEQTVTYLDQLHGTEPTEEEREQLDTPSNDGPAMPPFQDPSLAAAEGRNVRPESELTGDGDGDQYDEMNKAALKAEAERRELPTSGTAEELRERLRAHDAEQA